MTEDRLAKFTRLRIRRDALTAEFNEVKRAHEAGELPFKYALARHKAITIEAHIVAEKMRALVPDRSNPTPPISN